MYLKRTDIKILISLLKRKRNKNKNRPVSRVKVLDLTINN